jgi:hypothetical protein
VIAILGVIITIWLLSSATMKELKHVGIAIGIGVVIYLLMELAKGINPDKPKINF